ncbi:MAG: GNAT family N-acetyltransferase [Kiloniellales bacterium]
MAYRIDVATSVAPAEGDEIDRQHAAYEAAHGVVCDYQAFIMTLRSETGDLIGALRAYTAYAEIYVDDLWIDDGHRRHGLGKALLSALEDRYRDQGYNNINLVTSAFQAAPFYEKCGFEKEFVRVNRHHPALTKTFFVKYFKNETQNRGVVF